MLIILEGPDGAGKSTLAGELARALHDRYPDDRIRVLHQGPPTRHPLDEYEEPLHGYQPRAHEHVICDRWHLGEVVYPPVLGRPTQLGPEVLAHLELFLRARGALVVLVDEELAILERRVTSRGDDLIAPGQLRDLQRGYYQATANSLLRICSSRSVDDILHQARVQENTHASLADFVTYVGPRYPELLLLGDVRNTDRTRPSPAFAPKPSTSGSYLMRALLSQSADLGKIGIANACDVDDVSRLVSTLAGPLVVALGNNAFHRCRQLGIDVAWKATHPQYARRFHYDQVVAYGEEVLGKWN